MVENGKSEHHQWILHIWISLRTKFNFTQTIYNFRSKFTQKRYFLLMTTQKEDFTIKFCWFELF